MLLLNLVEEKTGLPPIVSLQTVQGAYNSRKTGKPGKLRDFLILENSGKFQIYSVEIFEGNLFVI